MRGHLKRWSRASSSSWVLQGSAAERLVEPQLVWARVVGLDQLGLGELTLY